MAGSESDEGILLQRVAAGDSDALLALHKRYANLVYSVAWRVLHDVGLVEEVTQDVFMKLWQRSQSYDAGRGRFSAWLLSVTRFAAIDRLRQEGRHRAGSAAAHFRTLLTRAGLAHRPRRRAGAGHRERAGRGAGRHAHGRERAGAGQRFHGDFTGGLTMGRRST